MRLDGIHHVTCITADARVPGLRDERAHLGEALRLPPRHEHLRDRLERRLTPLTNPRATAARP
jgi:hypothetical protein